MSFSVTSGRVPKVAAGGIAGLLAGALIATGIGHAAGIGRPSGPSDQSKALVVLRADGQALTRLTGDVSDDAYLNDLHASAQTAQQLAEAARTRDTALAILGDAAVRANATRAHNATVKILTAYGQLTDVTATSLDAWDDDEANVVSALGELDAATAPVAVMDPKRPLRLQTRPIEALTEKVSTYFTTSSRKLATFEKRTTKFRKRNRKRIQHAADYRSSVVAQMGAYNTTRDDLQSYLSDAQSLYTEIDDFRLALQNAKSRRAGIRATLAALAPPPSVQGEHQRVVAVLDHAINATDLGVDLADAIQRRRDEGDVETSAFDLPEYTELGRQSQQITNERSAAMSNWTHSMDAYVRHLTHPKGAPKQPVI